MSEEDRAGADALEKRLTTAAKYGLPAATVAIAIAAGAIQGPAAAVLVLAGGALVAVIAIFWSSVRTLVGEAPLAGADAYALAAPRAEEEQKRAVLRALKDLEFERSVGKISEEDFTALTAKYRAEAKRLLKALDEEAQPRRELVEALIQRRLARAGLAGDAQPSSDAELSSSKAPLRKAKKGKRQVEASDPEETGRACAKCGTTNDEDAVFCKKCGTRQAPEAEADADESEPRGEREEAS